MTIQEIYDLAIEMGMNADPRGAVVLKKQLQKLAKDFKELSEKKKKFFDPETLKNPYSDSRFLIGDSNQTVKKLMAGIDADAAEVLLVDRLNEKGAKIDLLISHHPSGHALASLHEVMDIQTAMAASIGVPVNVAHALLQERKSYVQRRFSPLNHSQAVDAAKHLEIPLMVLHTIWDNLGNQFMHEYMEDKEFDTVGEVVDYVKEIPEFVESTKAKAAPFIAAGSKSSKAGKIAISFTGGTNPSKEFYVEVAKAGIGTLIEMHVPEEAITELRKMHVNVIDCGHMAADSIGANIFLDELENRGIEVLPGSGLIRVKRKDK